MQQNNRVESQFQIHPAPRAAAQRDGQPKAPTVAGGRLPRITQVLALAMQFREMIPAAMRGIVPTSPGWAA